MLNMLSYIWKERVILMIPKSKREIELMAEAGKLLLKSIKNK